MTGILFLDNQVSNKVKDKPGIIAEALYEHWAQFIFINDFMNDDTGTNLQAAVPVSKGQFLLDFSLWNVYLESLAGKH